MGFMDELKRLAHPYEDDEEFVEEAEDEAPEEEAERPRKAPRKEEGYFSAPAPERRSSSDNVVNINTTTQL